MPDGANPVVNRPTATVSRDRSVDDEWDTLASALNDYGVIHVAPRQRREPDFRVLPQRCSSGF